MTDNLITLKFTQDEIVALLGACDMAAFGFQFGGDSIPNDPGTRAMHKLEEAQKKFDDS